MIYNKCIRLVTVIGTRLYNIVSHKHLDFCIQNLNLPLMVLLRSAFMQSLLSAACMPPDPLKWFAQVDRHRRYAGSSGR